MGFMYSFDFSSLFDLRWRRDLFDEEVLDFQLPSPEEVSSLKLCLWWFQMISTNLFGLFVWEN